MPFGRHRVVPLDELPVDYLQRLAWLDDLREPLRGAVFAELRERGGATQLPLLRCSDPALAQELVVAGRRSLARELHPDVGGRHEDFVRLGEVSEWFEDVIGASS